MRTALELLALAAVAAVAAGVASYANARPAADGNRVGPASAAPFPESGGAPSVVVTMEVGGAPSSIVATARGVWVSLGLRGLAKVDPTTNDVVARVRPGGALVDVAAGFGAVWAVDVFGDRLLRIDPRTNRVTFAAAVGSMPSGVVVGHGLVWVTSQLRSTVSGVDPRTGRVVKVVRFSYGELWPGGIAVTRDGVWVITGHGNELTLVDPEPFVVARRVFVPGARTLAVTGRLLWVGLARSAELLRIGSGSDGVSRVSTPGFRSSGYGPALAGGSRLWLATRKGVLVVDPASGSARAVLRFSRDPDVTALATKGDVWMADQRHAAVVRARLGSASDHVLASPPLHRPA
jgi:streptogramin lyase